MGVQPNKYKFDVHQTAKLCIARQNEFVQKLSEHFIAIAYH